jgi:hypothetical protein
VDTNPAPRDRWPLGPFAAALAAAALIAGCGEGPRRPSASEAPRPRTAAETPPSNGARVRVSVWHRIGGGVNGRNRALGLFAMTLQLRE